ncbi:MAG: hypothetical protein IKY67_13715 [Paludibacteraceae bacterium]|nr:hypothetical protein [Paludibacteraceae bacterium]
MNAKELLKQIAVELDSLAVYDEFEKNVAGLKTPKTRLCVIGQPNCGKTTIINTLLSLDLPVTSLSSNKKYAITYGEVSQDEKLENDAQCILVKDEWVHKHNLEIVELNHDVVVEELSQIELCKMLSQCDVCIYIMNAQAAFNRIDKFILQNLNEVALPTKVVMSRADLLSDEDYIQVLEFVKNNLNELSYVNVVDMERVHLNSIESSLLKSSVDDMLANADIAASRGNFENFYLGYALSKLFETCQNNISVCQEKQEKVKELALSKKNDLRNKSTEWLKLETQLRQKSVDLSNKLREFLAGREGDMLRRLSHDVDVCGDVKLFWEKDFQFRLEELMKLEIQSATQMVNQELIKTIQWLQDSLLKQFKCRISMASGLTSDNHIDSMSSASNVEISDTNKLKIVTRIGTAATVIAAGALFATSGIGGIIMAVSMVSGIGAEFFMRKQTNDSKDNIKKHLPEIISRAQLQVVTDFDQKIQNLTNEFIAQLQTLKKEWEDSSIMNIEQEESIAIYNFSHVKWNNVMSRINQLSEILLK